MDICVEHLPRPDLRPYVECVWYSEPTTQTDFEILPDGSIDACFVLSEARPSLLLFGTATRATAYELERDTPYFGVRFRPGAAPLFIREKPSELTDMSVAVDDLLGVRAERILSLGSFAARRALVEEALASALARSPGRPSPLVAHAISTIDRRHGDVKIRGLAAQCGVGERQLERLFAEWMGISPKLYARIRRFRSVLDHLDDIAGAERPSWALIAASYGYSDQSHLARDLRSLSRTQTQPD